MTTRINWTSRDKIRLMDIIKTRIDSGDMLRDAVKFASKEVNRSFVACMNKYYMTINKPDRPESSLASNPALNYMSISDYIQGLEVKNLDLEVENERLLLIEKEFQALMDLINKARKKAFVGEDEERQRFKMDQNGNLERLN